MKYIQNATDAGIEFNTLENQIISPLRSSWIGTIPLNMRLQQYYNSTNLVDQCIELPRHTWDHNTVNVARGDKVVCTENTYDMRNYHDRYEKFNDEDIGLDSTFITTPDHSVMLNGETGIVEDIFADGSLLVRMEDRSVFIPATYQEYNYYSDNFHPVDPRKRVDLAYVLTTHKCQGSEFNRVVYVISGTRPHMLNRRNFYTAVTRAREHVMTICDQKALAHSLRPYAPMKPKHRKEITEWTSPTSSP
jgi:exodeoxyribonuclease V alpha subunit